MTTVTETIRRYSAELEEDWVVFAKVARYSVYKVPLEDREDFLQDLLVKMARVKEKYDAQGKTLTEAGLRWVARYEVWGYWDKRSYRLFRPICRYCAIEQRQECQATRLPSECPKGKARRLLSLDRPAENDNGYKLDKLNALITSNKPIDLDAKLDARRILQGLPKRLVKIGYKISAGTPLEKEEEEYLIDWRLDHLDECILGLFRKTAQGRTRPQLSTNSTSTSTRQQVHEVNLHVRKLKLGEGILELLRSTPDGMTREGLSMRLQAPVRELNSYINRLVERQQVIEVKRKNSRGRPPAPLLLIAGAEIPEQENVVAEGDERIRQAYFIKGWSIKRINRELHHCKRTIRRAIDGIPVKRS